MVHSRLSRDITRVHTYTHTHTHTYTHIRIDSVTYQCVHLIVPLIHTSRCKVYFPIGTCIHTCIPLYTIVYYCVHYSKVRYLYVDLYTESITPPRTHAVPCHVILLYVSCSRRMWLEVEQRHLVSRT